MIFFLSLAVTTESLGQEESNDADEGEVFEEEFVIYPTRWYDEYRAPILESSDQLYTYCNQD